MLENIIIITVSVNNDKNIDAPVIELIQFDITLKYSFSISYLLSKKLATVGRREFIPTICKKDAKNNKKININK